MYRVKKRLLLSERAVPTLPTSHKSTEPHVSAAQCTKPLRKSAVMIPSTASTHKHAIIYACSSVVSCDISKQHTATPHTCTINCALQHARHQLDGVAATCVEVKRQSISISETMKNNNDNGESCSTDVEH